MQEHVTNQHFGDTVVVESAVDSSVENKIQTNFCNPENIQDTSDIKISDIKDGVSEAKENKCERCQKTFSNKNSKLRHVKEVHLKIKNYKCSKCDRVFSKNDHLKTHFETVHQKLRKFKCEECGKSFSKKCSLKAHIKVIHKSIPINTLV